MLIPKLTSSREAVEQYYSTVGTQTEITDDDVRLWVAELVDLIGYPLQYIPKAIGYKQDPDYQFDNYSVPLPCDFYKLMPSGISVNGNSVRWRQNSFHYLLNGDCCDLENLNNITPQIFVDQFGNEFSPQASVNPHLQNAYQEITFDITNNKIVFNIKEGTVCMAYWSYPIDNQGYMMIPDTAKFKRAVSDYLMWKTDYILWRQNLLSNAVYQESKSMKEWSISSCSAELKIPDVEQLHVLKQGIIRLLPQWDGYSSFYRDFGTQEHRFNRR